MRNKLAGTLFIIALIGSVISCKTDYSTDASVIAKGKQTFSKYCASCHGLNQDGFGPKLGGITSLLSHKTLVDFIKDPLSSIETQKRAAWLHERYKRTMPAFDWMADSEINAILSYISYETELNQIKPLEFNEDLSVESLTGELVPPVKLSDIKIELEEVIQIDRLEGSLDLGIVTLRAHPSKDGTLFINEQNGVIYRISEGEEKVFIDMRKEIPDFKNGPGIATGVGSFDFHPDYLNNGLIYILHAETNKGQSTDYAVYDTTQSEVQWVLSEWKMDDVNDVEFKGTRREMLRTLAPTFAHGAQELSFIPGLSPDDPEYGLMYISYGDGGSNNIGQPELHHHLKSFLGTIIRIDPLGNNSTNGKYGIPEDNPFVNEPDPETVKEIYAYGFRNCHRFAWDPTNNNRMLITDIGEANIEELNIGVKGGDYGWPIREGDYGILTTRDVKTVFTLTEADLNLYQRPFAQYDHSKGNAISGGHVYEGEITALKGKYIFGDIVTGELFYLNMDPDLSDSTIYQLTIEENSKVTTLKKMSDTDRLHLRIGYDPYAKELYVITKSDGRIRKIVNAK